MIKILFFIETLEGGGAEKVLRNLVNNMDKSKFDITVQTLFPCEAKKYLSDGIHYRSVYKSENKMTRLIYRAEAQSGAIYPLHIKGDYDIEVAYLEFGSTKIMSSSTNKNAKKIAWVHTDLKNMFEDAQGVANQTRGFYQKYDEVICVSVQSQKSFKELFGDAIKTRIIYNTVDDSEIKRKADEEQINNGKFTVVCVGRLAAPKKYERLLSAHKRLLDEGFDHKLQILGEGPEREKIKKYIEENNLSSSVELLGFRQNPYPYMKNANLLACSSVYEGFSTFITEGVILGKPIVTTDVSGMREILGDSEFGLITENDDEAFYQGMKKFFEDKNLLRHYEEKAKIRGTAFSTENLVSATEKFFKSLCGE